MKPNLINTIIDRRATKSGIEYLNVIEAGDVLKAGVLSNLIMYALSSNLNIAWEVEGARHWVGSENFLSDMASTSK